MTRAKKNPTCEAENMWSIQRGMVRWNADFFQWQASRAGSNVNRLFPTYPEALAYALNEAPERRVIDDPVHARCEREDPHHDCRCHIAPPCSACVECPSWDEKRWGE